MGERKKKQEEVLQSSTVQDVNIFCKSRDNEHEKRNLSPKATSSQLAAALSLNLKSWWWWCSGCSKRWRKVQESRNDGDGDEEKSTTATQERFITRTSYKLTWKCCTLFVCRHTLPTNRPDPGERFARISAKWAILRLVFDANGTTFHVTCVNKMIAAAGLEFVAVVLQRKQKKMSFSAPNASNV